MARAEAAHNSQSANHSIDWWLLVAAMALLAFGLTMVLSSSAVMAERFYGSKYFFFQKQLVYAGAGLLVMCFISLMPRSLLYRLQYPALLGAVLLLIATLAVGPTINGAKRWLSVGPFTIQPLEFTKIALVLYLSYFLSAKQELVKTFDRGVIPPFAVTMVLCLFLLAQPDFGGAAVLALILFFMCLVGGTRLIYLIASAGLACASAWLLIVNSPYRSRRLLAFLDPFADALGTGYQLVQSLYALGAGGVTGVGLGVGSQKLFFLPEAHNDFIMAVVGEELGFLGVTLVFAMMVAFFYRAFLVALRQEDLRDRLTAFGVTIILALGATLNMAVVLGVAPPKGVPMPFLSYGGSSLLATLICVGLLLNFSKGSSASGAGLQFIRGKR
ncbi:putative lipid II flippase FtsW [Oleidesulfovibrio sp.]|uniref:putative lipid II flippase FtsW n=1 Tax=Oleidesulfovibrio sp. TaxID=2909707 RepID=UPI003A89A586